MAPAEDVPAVNQNGGVERFHGTSASAPLTTGVAGLLKSFDRSLSASEIKQLIIAGAVRGGRTAAGTPIVNAYESLKLAAERPGAPLCGNRVLARPRSDNSGSNVYAERGPSGTLELIATLDIFTSVAPMLFHGGRRIDDFYTDASWAYDEASRSFLRNGWSTDHPFEDGDDGGTYNSANGINHAGTRIFRYAFPLDILGQATGELAVERADYSSRQERILSAWSPVATFNLGTNGRDISFNMPVSPNGDTAYVALGDASGWRYVGLSLATQTTFPLFETDSLGSWPVEWFAISEDGREMVAREVELLPDGSFGTCRVIFRNLDPTRLGQSGETVAVGAVLRPADPDDCGGNYWSAAVSPSISAGERVSRESLPTRLESPRWQIGRRH